MRAVSTWTAFALLGLTQMSLAIDLRPGVQDQIKIGREAAAEINKKEKLLPKSDPRVELLNRLGTEMVAKIPEAERKRRPFEYTFNVIDNKEVNAFALPGGPIYFYVGLIDRMKTVDELAGVLGHEITHVRNQHWASQEGDRLKRQLPLAVLLELINAGRTAWDIAALADAVLVGVKYSRRHETEADRVGFDLMTAIGYNPQGLADTFRMLADGRRMSDFDRMLSTHPDPAKRAETIEARIAREKKTYRPQVPLPFKTRAMSGQQTAWIPATGFSCWCGHDHGEVEEKPLDVVAFLQSQG